MIPLPVSLPCLVSAWLMGYIVTCSHLVHNVLPLSTILARSSVKTLERLLQRKVIGTILSALGRACSAIDHRGHAYVDLCHQNLLINLARPTVLLIDIDSAIPHQSVLPHTVQPDVLAVRGIRHRIESQGCLTTAFPNEWSCRSLFHC